MNSRIIRLKFTSIFEAGNSTKTQRLVKMKEMLILSSRSVLKSMLQDEAVVHCVENKNEDILASCLIEGEKSLMFMLSSFVMN